MGVACGAMITRREIFGAPALLLRAARTRRPNILFLVSDDQSAPHTGAAGDPVVRTPALDRVARSGVRFTNAFCATPSCTASRSAILTGQEPYRLEESANLWSTLRTKFDVYPDLLERAGYQVGLTGKGWGPGKVDAGGRARNPAGPEFRDFGEFLKQLASGQPFCFWFGGKDPHRPYTAGTGVQAGMREQDVAVPAFLPDSAEVRRDLLDYYFAIERFDRHVEWHLRLLEKSGRAEDTIVIVTSDNGMPFPRAKANLYDAGTRLPLAISWPAAIQVGRVVEDFISFIDFAPTILEAAGVSAPRTTTGRSFLNVLLSGKSGVVDASRDHLFMSRERHGNMRSGGVGYPCRAIRTRTHLYIRNLAPERWPAGDPEDFGDIDASPTKECVLRERGRFYNLAVAKRPPEELYGLANDPAQIQNIAARPGVEPVLTSLRERLDRRLRATADPRISGGKIMFDEYPYYGGPYRSRM